MTDDDATGGPVTAFMPFASALEVLPDLDPAEAQTQAAGPDPYFLTHDPLPPPLGDRFVALTPALLERMEESFRAKENEGRITAPGLHTDDAGWAVYFTGNCPLQGFGYVDGRRAYFRARGQGWSLGIGGADPVHAPEWSETGAWGAGPHDAGWMRVDEAIALIGAAVRRYRARDKA